MPPPSINAERLHQTLAELGHFGDSPQGMQRLAFSSADVAGREYVISLLRQAGMSPRIDPAGNIIARREGSRPDLPAIALGSHTDTVPNGGKYDGALGVVGAIECVQTLANHRLALQHPLETLIFTNEEGTRYNRWLFGSRAMAGLLEPADLTAVDYEGVPLSVRLADIGGDMNRIEQARRSRGELAAYFELHIEQGPTLYQSQVPIGVVTGITGRAVFQVTLQGAANHAGATPMSLRRDALVAAARLALAVNRLSAELEICRVATVGTIQVEPNAVNVIPGLARLEVEFRDVDLNALSAAEAHFRSTAAEIAYTDCVEISVTPLEFTPSVPISQGMQNLVAEASEACDLRHQRLPSGAGHDAQAIANIAPIAMIFVPSVDGISHAPEEFSTPEDCANGANALLQLLLLADQRL